MSNVVISGSYLGYVHISTDLLHGVVDFHDLTSVRWAAVRYMSEFMRKM